MTYITVMQSPKYEQMTLEDFLSSKEIDEPTLISYNYTNTRTYKTNRVPEKLLEVARVDLMACNLIDFVTLHEELYEKDRASLYQTFHIPKTSGGYRRIDAPNEELMFALRQLKRILESGFGQRYHTSSFAYVKNRSTLKALKRHQSNKSKWFAKFDLSNFFGSTTLEFSLKMISMIFPFSELKNHPGGFEALEKALSLAFLNGGLPQGTPVSPLITNIIMIPIDHKISNNLRSFDDKRFVYTRYADDFLISCRYDFQLKKIERYLLEVLSDFQAPYKLSDKTRYGSSSGSNWNLGLMLNKDNRITIGHKRRKRFKAALSSYAMDKMNNKPQWDSEDIHVLSGQISYYKMIEGKNIDDIINHIGDKFNVKIMEEIKKDLRSPFE